jgi:hypothetical protein
VLRIGISGHTNLTADSVPLVRDELEALLNRYATSDLVGVSCLARGADQIFAQAVLDANGELEVILPAADYRERKVKPDNAAEFNRLIKQATVENALHPVSQGNSSGS